VVLSRVVHCDIQVDWQVVLSRVVHCDIQVDWPVVLSVVRLYEHLVKLSS